ncbi:hypothetical protein PV10_03497 [Exophiala mesophila]|uniref:Piwi domain-containing protein n=1 Tax=Exophiala mesophila TaxID=212818 RepID=A0A0D1Y5C9_EXOME|nr:uncharacterized protein PV10_03497 [Exophiala mesophila]KIV95896.1 hypothetical protein PV10_03497 [Exophiala mesophila]
MGPKAAAKNKKRRDKKRERNAREAEEEGQSSFLAQSSSLQEIAAPAGQQELSIESNGAGSANNLPPALPDQAPRHQLPQNFTSSSQYSGVAQSPAMPPPTPSNNPTPFVPGTSQNPQSYKAHPDDTGENLRQALAKLQIGLNHANVGATHKLCANYFPIKVNIGIIFQYPLTIVRMSDNERGINRNQKKRVVHILMQKLNEANDQTAIATNYHDQILSDSGNLKAENFEIPGEVIIGYYDEYQNHPPPNPSQFQITISQPKALRYDSLFRDLSLKSDVHTDYPDKEDAINALNIIFSYGPYQASFADNPTTTPSTNVPTLTTVGGHRFYGVVQPQHSGQTATGPTLNHYRPTLDRHSILGFSRSVRSHKGEKGSLNLNVNTATAIFYREGTVSQLIQRWRDNTHDHSDQALAGYLSGVTVRTMYHSNDQNYLTTICGVPRRPPGLPANQEVQDGNTPMRAPGYNGDQLVRAYFSSMYNIHSSCAVRVVMIGNPRDPSLAPANQLWVLPGQMYRDPLEKPFGAIRPSLNNRQKILDLGPRLFYEAGSKGAAEFQLELSKEMLQVPVDRLETPLIEYLLRKANGRNNPKGLDKGKWNLRDCEFSKTPTQPIMWTCFSLTQFPVPGLDGKVKAFQGKFDEALKIYGVRLTHRNLTTGMTSMSPWCYQYTGRLQDYYSGLEELFAKISAGGSRMVVLLLPKKDPELYGAIKRICDTSVGVVSICHVMEKVDGSFEPKSDVTFFGNLCMKANLKLTSSSVLTVNQRLTHTPPILSDVCMIMGIDVTHPGPWSYHRAPSVAAVVGSTDGAFAQWPASLRANYPRTANDKKKKEAMEEVVPLKTMVLERLNDFKRRLPNHPLKRLIVYRDGLSESQFRMCQERELASINAALDEFTQDNQDVKPKVLLICTVKRHQTRLFPIPGQQTNPILTKNHDEGAPNNPRPGTWVSDRITYGEGNDFFLYSHQAIQGTARPTHYVILHNEEKHGLRTIAQMTHQLCYLFGRATRSVSVCPAAYYADLACDRARHYVRRFYHAPNAHGPRETFDTERDGPEFDRLLRPHDNIKGTMFYI